METRKVFEGKNLVVIVGGFNYLLINWCDRRYTSPISGNFIDFFEIIFLNRYVKEGTSGGNILDLIFSNVEIIENLRVGENIGLSYHQIIRSGLKLESKAQIKNSMVLNFREAN